MIETCVCGVKKKDRSNWSKHRRICPALKIEQQLRAEIHSLRELKDKAEESAAQRREEAIERLERRLATQAEQQAVLVSTVAAMETRLQAFVPASTTINNVQNNQIIINICPYEKTPVPPRKTVTGIFKQPNASIPAYFGHKHLSAPKTRNLRITDAHGSKMSVYTRDRHSGLSKWVERDRKGMLVDIVRDIIFDLHDELSAPKDPAWEGWRRWAFSEGLKGYSNAHEMEAFQSAVHQIEQKIIDGTEGS